MAADRPAAGRDPARPVIPITHPLDATVTVPGSKSLTNRALVCAALAAGRSTVENARVADDSLAMRTALGALGVAGDHGGHVGGDLLDRPVRPRDLGVGVERRDGHVPEPGGGAVEGGLDPVEVGGGHAIPPCSSEPRRQQRTARSGKMDRPCLD